MTRVTQEQIDAQQAKLQEIWERMQQFKNATLRQSEAYQRLETRFREEADLLNAMQLALPKED